MIENKENELKGSCDLNSRTSYSFV